MLKKSIYFIFIFLIVSNVISQNNKYNYDNVKNYLSNFDKEQYYYYNGNKKFISKTSNYIFVTFIDQNYKNYKNNLLNINSKIKFVKELEIDELKAILYKTELYTDNNTNIFNELNTNNDICYYYPVYLGRDSSKILLSNKIIYKVKKGYSEDIVVKFLKTYNATIVRKILLGGYDNQIVAKITKEFDAFDVSNKLYESGLVDFAEPNFIFLSNSETKQENNLKKYSNDKNKNLLTDPPRYEPIDLNIAQWYLDKPLDQDIDAPEAWYVEKGGNCTIAILDASGCDIYHPDLINKVRNPYNAWNGNFNLEPICCCDRHMTMIAGLIAAETDNNVQSIASIGFNNFVMPVKIGTPEYCNIPCDECDPHIILDPEHVGIGAEWIISHSVNDNIVAVSISWNWDESNSITNSLYKLRFNSREGKGASICCASGNTDDPIQYPSDLEFVIAVGGTDIDDLRYWYYCFPWPFCTEGSNYGEGLDIVAPEYHMFSTDIRGEWGYEPDDYAYATGTSFACPLVASALGLLYSRNPSISVSEAEERLLRFGVDKIHPEVYNYEQREFGLWNNEVGYGRLNVYSLLQPPFPEHICLDNVVIQNGQSINYTAYNSITAPCNSSNTIFQILNGGSSVMSAGNYILLKPGFWAENGSSFLAKIQPIDESKDISLIIPKLTSINNHKEFENKDKILNENLPKEFQLFQNYPNPFNPITSIKVGLASKSYVTLIVYDILGREIIRLLEGYYDAGYKIIFWDGKDSFENEVSSGVYFYKLDIQINNITFVNKMVLMK